MSVTLIMSACSTDGEVDEPTGPTPAASAPTPDVTESASGPAPGGSLRFALGGDPESIDPRFVADDEGTIVVDQLFDSLVALDDDLEVVPAAAESWTVSDDQRVFTFTLRDATFHDGSAVTAQDFVRGFQRMADATADPPSFLGYQLAPVVGYDDTRGTGAELAGVTAVDERTLRIELTAPFAEFLDVLTHPSLGPVPSAAEENPDSFARRPVGNGPFQMAESSRPGEFIRMTRFEGYAMDPALLDEVVFRIFSGDPTHEVQYEEFSEGVVDVVEIPVDQLETAREEYGSGRNGLEGPGVLDGPLLTIYYYGFNNELPPFDDAAVRRAFSLLIDRERITEDLLLGARDPATAVVPPGTPGYQAGVCDHCRYAPEEALELLADRLEGLESVNLLHNTGDTHEAIAARVSADIEAALGVTVDVESRDLRPFVQRLRSGEMQIFRLGWPADYPSMGAFLYPLFHSSTVGTDNLARYRNEEVDALLEQARSEPDRRDRIAAYRAAEERILADAAIAPIMTYRQSRLVAEDVRDFALDPLGRVDLARVWIDGDA